jgi:uncharacterized protein with NRDE domain
MCTLILAVDVLGRDTLLLGANRDEDPSRPSDPPGILSPSPRVVGGRDRRSGGTWLAVRASGRVVAILNRRVGDGIPAPDPRLRSRGLLALDVAGADDPRDTATAALDRDRFAPFTLVVASPGDAWALEYDGLHARIVTLEPGWHVITHERTDDRGEPRTAWLLDQIARTRPATRADAEARVVELLRDPGDSSHPAVCIHEGRMVTVSAARVWLAPGERSYAHAEGRPCEAPFRSYDALLAD